MGSCLSGILSDFYMDDDYVKYNKPTGTQEAPLSRVQRKLNEYKVEGVVVRYARKLHILTQKGHKEAMNYLMECAILLHS
jgi:hypothetical protein